jgi:signal peptidase II
VLDLLTKRFIVALLHPFERRVVVPGMLDVTYVQNPYGAMGLFGDRPVLLIVLAAAVIAVIAYVLRDTVGRSALAQIGFGLVVGGALGNIVDRFVHHFVVDFIAPRGFYVFNVGDACISIGIALIVAAGLRLAPSATPLR